MDIVTVTSNKCLGVSNLVLALNTNETPKLRLTVVTIHLSLWNSYEVDPLCEKYLNIMTSSEILYYQITNTTSADNVRNMSCGGGNLLQFFEVISK